MSLVKTYIFLIQYVFSSWYNIQHNYTYIGRLIKCGSRTIDLYLLKIKETKNVQMFKLIKSYIDKLLKLRESNIQNKSQKALLGMTYMVQFCTDIIGHFNSIFYYWEILKEEFLSIQKDSQNTFFFKNAMQWYVLFLRNYIIKIPEKLELKNGVFTLKTVLFDWKTHEMNKSYASPVRTVLSNRINVGHFTK